MRTLIIFFGRVETRKSPDIMKFLIFGRGWLSQHFVNQIVVREHTYIFAQSRAEQESQVRQEIYLEKPDRVICAIGRTHGQIGDQVWNTIDYLEQPDKLVENLRDNLYAPLVLARVCQEFNIHMTYLGTGCIFEYDEKHPLGGGKGFTEQDDPNFTGSSYSTVKGYTDRLLRQQKGILNLRIRMPISDEDVSRNFITKITTYERICSIANSMTVLNDLMPHMIDLSIRQVDGTVNMTNPGAISHNEILSLYQQIVNPSFQWKNFSLEEQGKILASGRSNNYLETSRLCALCPSVRPIRIAIIEVLQKIKDRRAGFNER